MKRRVPALLLVLLFASVAGEARADRAPTHRLDVRSVHSLTDRKAELSLRVAESRRKRGKVDRSRFWKRRLRRLGSGNGVP